MQTGSFTDVWIYFYDSSQSYLGCVDGLLTTKQFVTPTDAAYIKIVLKASSSSITLSQITNADLKIVRMANLPAYKTSTSFSVSDLAANYVLTAIALPIEYHVHFVSQLPGMTFLYVNTDGTRGTQQVAGTTADMAGLKYDNTYKLPQVGYSLTGYTFKGWSLDQKPTEDTTLYADEGSIRNLTANNNATVTLYAVWEADEIVITFDFNIPSALKTSTATVSPTFKIKGLYGLSYTSYHEVVFMNGTTETTTTETYASLLEGKNLAGYIFMWWTNQTPTTSNNNLIVHNYRFDPSYDTLDGNNVYYFGQNTIYYAEWYQMMSTTTNSILS